MNQHTLHRAVDAQRLTFDWGELHWYASGSLGNSAHQTLGRCILKPGRANPRHHHPNCEELLHVLTGRIEHFVEGAGWLTMQPGDTITIPAGLWHHARNVGDHDAHLLIAFNTADRQTVGESDDAIAHRR